MKLFFERYKIIIEFIVVFLVFAVFISVVLKYEKNSSENVFYTSIVSVKDNASNVKKTSMPLIATAQKISNGEVLTIEENCIKKNKQLTFTGDISVMDTIVLRHGKDSFGSSYVSINNKTIDVYYYSSSYKLVKSVEHGLTINGQVECVLSVSKLNELSIKLSANNRSYSVDNVYWGGTRGKIQLESVNTEITNAKLTWSSDDYEKDVWIFGDSYVEINYTRWPYYVIPSNDNFLLSGYGGATSAAMYNDWKTALTHETPKYAVWCLGMNDEDTEDGINASWLNCVKLFIADCEENNITPILATIPNTPTNNNTFKNEYVRNSGLKYIDFATAVGANEPNSSWHDGMLSSDNIHPAKSGAQALAKQIEKDLLEIK